MGFSHYCHGHPLEGSPCRATIGVQKEIQKGPSNFPTSSMGPWDQLAPGESQTCWPFPWGQPQNPGPEFLPCKWH